MQAGHEPIILQLKNLTADKEEMTSKKNDYKQYSQKIKITNRHGDLLKILQDMINDELYPNKFIVAQLIKKFSQLESIDYAEKIYNDAISKDVFDVYVVNNMIDAAGKNGRIDLAILAYNNATRPDHYVADEITHNIMIDAAGRNGCIDQAILAYNNATNPDHYVADKITHTVMIDAAGKNGHIDLAILAYNNATHPDHYVANEVTHTLMIDAAAKNGRIDFAILVYNNATNPDHYVADETTHNAMIDAAGKNGCIDQAIIAYNNATHPDHYVADEITHNIMIDAAGKNGCIDQAILAYNNATHPDHYVADGVTHTAMIDAAGKNGRIDLAILAYNNATHPDHYVADKITHTAMIDAAGKNGRIDLAILAYNNATNPDHYVADAVTHNTMIDVLLLNDNLQAAIEIYHTAGNILSMKITKDGHYGIDLHGSSYGYAYIALSEFIKANTEHMPFKIEIIYGKGLHSNCRGEKSDHALKRSVKKLVKDLQENYDLNLQVDPDNEGRALCHIAPKSSDKLNEDKKNERKLFPASALTFRNYDRFELSASAKMTIFGQAELDNAARNLLIAEEIEESWELHGAEEIEKSKAAKIQLIDKLLDATKKFSRIDLHKSILKKYDFLLTDELRKKHRIGLNVGSSSFVPGNWNK